MSFYDFFSIVVLIGVLLTIVKKRKTLFCLSNIVNIVFLLIFVIAPRVVGANNIIFNKPLLYSLLFSYVVLFLLLYRDVFIPNSTKKIKFERYNTTGVLLNVYILLFVLIIGYHLVTGSYSNLITSNVGNRRLETYYDDKTDILTAALGYLKMLFYALVSTVSLTRKNIRKTLIVFLLISIEVAATAEHRTPVITPILLGFVFYHLYVKKIRTVYFLSLAVGVILFMSIGSYVRAGKISEYEYRGFSEEMHMD